MVNPLIYKIKYNHPLDGHSLGVAKEIILANEVPVTEKIISHSRDFGYSEE